MDRRSTAPPENGDGPESHLEAVKVPSSTRTQDRLTLSQPSSLRDRFDRDLVQGCSAILRIVRFAVRFASGNARDRIADEMAAAMADVQDVADRPVTRADMIFDQLLIGCDDRGRR
jgi:hypothetical protein